MEISKKDLKKKDINTGFKNKIKYGVFSEITGSDPIIISEDKEELMDFCYSQNKNLYPKEIAVLSPLHCSIKRLDHWIN